MDVQQFRNLMAGVCAPVTVVTTFDEEGPHGATVSSFASLSLEPSLISIALDTRSRLLERIAARGHFGVNVLGSSQAEVATRFAGRSDDRFAGIPWTAVDSLPRLDGVAGWATCELVNSVEAGDHLLLIGRVTRAISTLQAPLVYAYRTFGTHSGFELRPRKPVVDQILACTH